MPAGTAGARRRQRVRRRIARCRRRERPHIRRRCAGDHARRHPVAPREHALQVDAVVAALDVGGGKPGDIAPGRAAEQQSGAGADRGPRSGLTGRRADDGAGGGAERGAGDGIGRDGVVVGLASGDSAKRGIRVLPAGRRVGLELRRRLRRPRQRRDAGPAGYLCAGGDEGACGERQQDRAQAHWTTFVLRTSVFARRGGPSRSCVRAQFVGAAGATRDGLDRIGATCGGVPAADGACGITGIHALLHSWTCG